MFWTDSGALSRISSANLDGSSYTALFAGSNNNVVWPSGLAVDAAGVRSI